MFRRQRIHPLEALKILGLDKATELTEEEVQKAFRNLARKYHQQRGRDNTEKFTEIVEAKKVVMEDLSHASQFLVSKKSEEEIKQGVKQGVKTVNWADEFTKGTWKWHTYTNNVS